MKTPENYLAELRDIRKMMEESSRFLSLSGLSGILVGIYALAGSAIAYKIIDGENRFINFFESSKVPQVSVLAAVVIILSLLTIVLLTSSRAKKAGKKFWNPGSRQMIMNLSLPIVSGGILCLIFVTRGMYEIVAPGTLIFYGLALATAAKYTRQEIFWLGMFEIVLGLFAAFLPGLGLLIWALGFGVLHIIYGTLMYFRYEHNSK